MIRYGVHGSAVPGLRISGIFRAKAGVHRECTPGELLGSTTPKESVRGKKLRPSPNPRSSTENGTPRVNPEITFSISLKAAWILRMFLRARTCGIPVVDA